MASESPMNGTKASPKNTTIDNLTDTLSKVQMDDENGDPLNNKSPNHPPRKLVIYPRLHLLTLYKSPLVKLPEDMPPLKDWFGAENEQNIHKKEPDGNSPTRERRFRRDQEDADSPRPSYRGALAQPSQMGNFKHQSLRSVDRDKDSDKERERDIRDKEGQDRLRHLSDKYDRDRLALPSNSTNLRNKDRDVAPHIGVGSSRLPTRERESTTNSTSRRPEPGGKKKLGEVSEDWRRDFGRSGRDDRSEISRRDRDRDDRDRPRSRVRDLSRPRRERSSSRRDRDRDDRDRRGDRDRDDYRRDRDDYRREKDEYPRRDRDSEKDADTDDPRRWRDDGKRDERVAARREREYRERTRDRPPRERDDAWDDRHGGRWTVVEERDSRNKRSSGRDRRSGALDDVRDKDDRRDRDRGGDRDKEKEPAWMDAYIPSGPGTGILGTKAGEGEIDGIQAFKKGMKAKEQKDAPTSEDSRNPEELEKPESGVATVSQPSENALDEIQLFKLMMKKEQSLKTLDASQGTVAEQVQNESALLDISQPPPQSNSVTDTVSLTSQSTSTTISSTQELPPKSGSETPQTLLSIFSSTSTGAGSLLPPTTSTTPSLESGLPKPTESRFFPKPLTSDMSSPIVSDNGSSSSQVPPQFNPPAGSRLLAFGARNQAGTPHTANNNQPPQQIMLGSLPQQHLGLQSSSDLYLSAGMASETSQRQNASHAMRTQQGYSPQELPSRANFVTYESPDNFGQDPLRRTPIIPPGFSAPSESNSSYVGATLETFGVNGPGSSLDTMNGYGKGSRFLKYFEEKGRDGQVPRKPSGPVGFQSSSPVANPRQDTGNLANMPAGHVDNTAMDDLFAMLNTSVQGQQGNHLNQMNSGPVGSQLGQNNLQPLNHHQLHHHQQMPPQSRLESLYDSRLDDRNFVPDGMVPGLRQVPPPRSRENNGMFADPLDDSMQFDPRRLPPHQRGLDPSVFQGATSMYNQQGNVGRSTGLPVQQPQFRNNASPNPMQGPGQQRLPPGLANLGGRPPHEPGQFMGQVGMQIHGPLAGNGPSPQPPFSNFANNGLGGFGNNPQMRGSPLHGGHPMSNPLGPNQMVLPGDLRGLTNPNQVQLMNLGGNIRNVGGFGGPQQGPLSQMQQPMNMRQQPQHQPNLQPHMIPHLAHHISNAQQPGGGVHTQELMALLLGGGSAHRE